MRQLAEALSNIVLALLVLTAIILILLPTIFASSLAMVYSGSMAPEMPVGALAVMETVDPAEIGVGDIVAFNPPRDPGVTVSHRVIEVVEEPALSFRTKGDANEDPDFNNVPAASVVSRVIFNVPHVGYALAYVVQYTRSQFGLVLFIGLPTILLIGSAVRDTNLALNPRRKRAWRQKKIAERRKNRRARHRHSGLILVSSFV